ncbi:L-serine ammonia-lyase [Schumannella soli]|uniref:L-serine dehydratase n=1 Tax=Schumannella soli TaxID=2590779 RepID=A0A506XXY1_9MICO|nr:L-serine ammonia-lyase [Schumannella soli]TPW74147.1 L-serine ammonia-lyase [Schumannella soli]
MHRSSASTPGGSAAPDAPGSAAAAPLPTPSLRRIPAPFIPPAESGSLGGRHSLTTDPGTPDRRGVAAAGTAYVSALELFSIGIGPSSSHTVGPMRAARDLVERMRAAGTLDDTARITVELFGSLGATGIGHGTPDAILAGLTGAEPETVDPDAVRAAWSGWTDGEHLMLGGTRPIAFARADVVFSPFTRLPGHPNALTFVALDADGAELARETYFSVGGGFIRREGDDGEDAPRDVPAAAVAAATSASTPTAFRTADQLLALCASEGATIAELARRAELETHPDRTEVELDAGLDAIWTAMTECIDAGLHHDGLLPGELKVRRRAAAIRGQLEAEPATALPGDWLGIYALAVNEQNAAGGRVVTAPTNGAAGILPAVARYWLDFLCAREGAEAARAGIREFLLTATALGSLFRANASISGAEGGCQAEVGSASAMAAGGLTAVLGGTPAQVENAAEIAMEHHLGLTCDPVGGLVQIPCIERNAIAASTAVTAARLALRGDGTHHVSLDTVVETMRQTGADMSTKYKETSEGGLAVNVVEC